MKQLSESIRNRLISALKDGADLYTRYWAEGLAVEMQTAANDIVGSQFKGDFSELEGVIELIDGYGDFLFEQGHTSS